MKNNYAGVTCVKQIYLGQKSFWPCLYFLELSSPNSSVHGTSLFLFMVQPKYYEREHQTKRQEIYFLLLAKSLLEKNYQLRGETRWRQHRWERSPLLLNAREIPS